jgi:hypothetical protein
MATTPEDQAFIESVIAQNQQEIIDSGRDPNNLTEADLGENPYLPQEAEQPTQPNNVGFRELNLLGDKLGDFNALDNKLGGLNDALGMKSLGLEAARQDKLNRLGFGGLRTGRETPLTPREQQEAAIREAIFQKNQEIAELDEQTGILDHAKEQVGNFLSGAAIPTAQVGFDVLNLGTKLFSGGQTSLDEMAQAAIGKTITEQFEEGKKATDEIFSTELLGAKRERTQLEDALFMVGAEDRIQEDIEEGYSSDMATVREELRQFEATLGNFSSQELINESYQVVGSLLQIGAIGALTRNIATAGLSAFKDPAAVQRFLKTKAGKKFLAEAGTVGGVGGASVTAGVSAGAERKADILNRPIEELRKSPDFRDLEAKLGDPEKARLAFADMNFNAVAGITAATAGITSIFTGSGRIFGNLFTKGGIPETAFLPSALAKATKLTPTPAAAAGAEFVQEAIESGVEQAAGTVAEETLVKGRELEDVTVAEAVKGTGLAAGKGARVGAVGGGVAASPAIITDAAGIIELTKDASKALGKGIQKGKDRKISDDPTSPDYDAVSSLGKTFRNAPTQEPGSKEFTEFAQDVRTHFTGVLQDIVKKADEIETAKAAGDREKVDSLSAEIDTLNKVVADVGDKSEQIIRAAEAAKVGERPFTQPEAVLKDKNASAKEQNAAVDELINRVGSSPINKKGDHDDLLDPIINTKKLPTSIKDVGRQFKQISKILTSPDAEGKRIGLRARKRIMEGSPNSAGVQSFIRVIGSAAFAQDKGQAEAGMTLLNRSIASMEEQVNRFAELETVYKKEGKSDKFNTLLENYNDRFSILDPNDPSKTIPLTVTGPKDSNVFSNTKVRANLEFELEALKQTARALELYAKYKITDFVNPGLAGEGRAPTKAAKKKVQQDIARTEREIDELRKELDELQGTERVDNTEQELKLASLKTELERARKAGENTGALEKQIADIEEELVPTPPESPELKKLQARQKILNDLVQAANIKKQEVPEETQQELDSVNAQIEQLQAAIPAEDEAAAQAAKPKSEAQEKRIKEIKEQITTKSTILKRFKEQQEKDTEAEKIAERQKQEAAKKETLPKFVTEELARIEKLKGKGKINALLDLNRAINQNPNLEQADREFAVSQVRKELVLARLDLIKTLDGQLAAIFKKQKKTDKDQKDIKAKEQDKEKQIKALQNEGIEKDQFAKIRKTRELPVTEELQVKPGVAIVQYNPKNANQHDKTGGKKDQFLVDPEDDSILQVLPGDRTKEITRENNEKLYNAIIIERNRAEGTLFESTISREVEVKDKKTGKVEKKTVKLNYAIIQGNVVVSRSKSSHYNTVVYEHVAKGSDAETERNLIFKNMKRAVKTAIKPSGTSKAEVINDLRKLEEVMANYAEQEETPQVAGVMEVLSKAFDSMFYDGLNIKQAVAKSLKEYDEANPDNAVTPFVTAITVDNFGFEPAEEKVLTNTQERLKQAQKKLQSAESALKNQLKKDKIFTSRFGGTLIQGARQLKLTKKGKLVTDNAFFAKHLPKGKRLNKNQKQLFNNFKTALEEVKQLEKQIGQEKKFAEKAKTASTELKEQIDKLNAERNQIVERQQSVQAQINEFVETSPIIDIDQLNDLQGRRADITEQIDSLMASTDRDSKAIAKLNAQRNDIDLELNKLRRDEEVDRYELLQAELRSINNKLTTVESGLRVAQERLAKDGNSITLTNANYRKLMLDGKRPFLWGTGKERRVYQSVAHAYESNKTGKFNKDVYEADWSGDNYPVESNVLAPADAYNFPLLKELLKKSLTQGEAKSYKEIKPQLNQRHKELLVQTGNFNLIYFDNKRYSDGFKKGLSQAYMEVRDEIMREEATKLIENAERRSGVVRGIRLTDIYDATSIALARLSNKFIGVNSDERSVIFSMSAEVGRQNAPQNQRSGYNQDDVVFVVLETGMIQDDIVETMQYVDTAIEQGAQLMMTPETYALFTQYRTTEDLVIEDIGEGKIIAKSELPKQKTEKPIDADRLVEDILNEFEVDTSLQTLYRAAANHSLTTVLEVLANEAMAQGLYSDQSKVTDFALVVARLIDKPVSNKRKQDNILNPQNFSAPSDKLENDVSNKLLNNQELPYMYIKGHGVFINEDLIGSLEDFTQATVQGALALAIAQDLDNAQGANKAQNSTEKQRTSLAELEVIRAAVKDWFEVAKTTVPAVIAMDQEQILRALNSQSAFIAAVLADPDIQDILRRVSEAPTVAQRTAGEGKTYEAITGFLGLDARRIKGYHNENNIDEANFRDVLTLFSKSFSRFVEDRAATHSTLFKGFAFGNKVTDWVDFRNRGLLADTKTKTLSEAIENLRFTQQYGVVSRQNVPKQIEQQFRNDPDFARELLHATGLLGNVTLADVPEITDYKKVAAHIQTAINLAVKDKFKEQFPDREITVRYVKEITSTPPGAKNSEILTAETVDPSIQYIYRAIDAINTDQVKQLVKRAQKNNLDIKWVLERVEGLKAGERNFLIDTLGDTANNRRLDNLRELTPDDVVEILLEDLALKYTHQMYFKTNVVKDDFLNAAIMSVKDVEQFKVEHKTGHTEFLYNDWNQVYVETAYDVTPDGQIIELYTRDITKEEFESERQKWWESNTKHFIKYTVPGGKDYEEISIVYPDLDVDDTTKAARRMQGHYLNNDALGHVRADIATDSEATLRILELQSDALQHAKNASELVQNDTRFKTRSFVQNMFLKNKKWEPFFVKAVIQNAAARGFKKVRFPVGDTVGNIQGYQSIQDRQRRIQNMEQSLQNAKDYLENNNAFQMQRNFWKDAIGEFTDNEVKWLESFSNWKQNFVLEKEHVPNGKGGYFTRHAIYSVGEPGNARFLSEAEFQKFKKYTQEAEAVQFITTELVNAEDMLRTSQATERFYDKGITNIIQDDFPNHEIITDSLGNSWIEVSINPFSDTNPIRLQKLGKNIVGQARLDAGLILIDQARKRADTLPHEYAHFYVHWFRDTPIIQEGIKRYGSEEALVTAIGKQAVKQEGQAWNIWKKFTNWVLEFLSDKEVLQVITDSFLEGVDLEQNYTYNNQINQAKQLYSKYRKTAVDSRGSQEDLQAFRNWLDSKNSTATIEQDKFLVNLERFVEDFAIGIEKTTHARKLPPYEMKKLDKALNSDPSMLLLDPDGLFNKQVQEAMAFTAYEYLGTRGTGTLTKRYEDIKKMYQKGPHEKLTKAEFEEARDGGSPQTWVAEDMGLIFISHMGMVFKDNPQGRHLKKAMALAMGNRILAALENREYIELKKRDVLNSIPSEDSTTGKTIKNAQGKIVYETFPREVTFVKIANQLIDEIDENGDSYTSRVPAPQIQKIIDSLVYTENKQFLHNITGSDKEPISATLEPRKDKGKRIKKSFAVAPDEQVDIVNGEQNKVWYRNATSELILRLQPNRQLRMAGAIANTDRLHVTEREGIIASNTGLKTDLESLSMIARDQDLRGTGIAEGFYFGLDIGKNSRVFYQGSDNPQASKVLRFAMRKEAWRRTYDKSSNESMEPFRLAILEAFGIKVDKFRDDVRKDMFEAIVNDPVILKGIEAIDYIMSGTIPEAYQQAAGVLSPEQMQELVEQDLENAIAKQKIVITRNAITDPTLGVGGEKFHTLHGLMELRNYINAPVDGTFTSELVSEVDGVANGVTLTFLQLVPKATLEEIWKMINRGGIYQENGPTTFNEWLSDPGQVVDDIYEFIIRNIDRKFQGFLKAHEKTMAKGEFAEAKTQLEAMIRQIRSGEDSWYDPDNPDRVSPTSRALLKYEFMHIMYGKELENIISDFSEEHLLEVYHRMAKIETSNDTAESKAEQLKQIEDDLREILEDKTITIEDPLTFELTRDQVKKWDENFRELFGGRLEDTLKDEFGILIDRTAVLNSVADLSFEYGRNVYDRDVTALEKEKGRKATEEELFELYHKNIGLLPVIHTPYNRNLNEGLPLAKMDTIRVRTNNKGELMDTVINSDGRRVKNPSIGQPYGTPGNYRVETRFAEGSIFTEKGARSQLSGIPSEIGLGHPSVSLGPNSIQMIDSFIMLRLMKALDILSAFDAAFTAAADRGEAARILDEALVEVSEAFSVVEEVNALFNRVETAARKDNNFTKAKNKAWFEKLEQTKKDLAEMTKEVSEMRAKLFEEIGISDNYSSGLESGAYRVQPVTSSFLERKKRETAAKRQIKNAYDSGNVTQNLNNSGTTVPEFKGKMRQVQAIPGFPNWEAMPLQAEESDTVDYWLHKSEDGTYTIFAIAPIGNFSEATLLDLDLQGKLNTENGTFLVQRDKFKPAKGFVITTVNEHIGVTYNKDIVDKKFKNSNLGSSHTGVNDQAFDQVIGENQDRNNLLEIFDLLGKADDEGNYHAGVVDPESHTRHLRESIIKDVASKFMRPFVLKLNQLGDINIGDWQEDERILRVQTGLRADQGTLISGLRMSAQEVYAHEVVHGTVGHVLDSDHKLARRAKALFDIADKQIKEVAEQISKDLGREFRPEEFFVNRVGDTYYNSQGEVIVYGTPEFEAELQLAKEERYDYIFNNPTQLIERHNYLGHKTFSTKNPFLQEFMALGVTNKNTMELFERMTFNGAELDAKAPPVQTNVLTEMMRLFRQMVNRIFHRVDSPYETNIYKELYALYGAMAAIQEDRESILHQKMGQLNMAAADILSDYIVSPIANLLRGDGQEIPIDPNDGRIVRIGKNLRNMAKEIPNITPESANKVLRESIREQNAMEANVVGEAVVELVREVTGLDEKHKIVENRARVASHLVEQGRKKEQSAIMQLTNASFDGDYTSAESGAATRSLLMTDVASIYSSLDEPPTHKYNNDGLSKLLLDENYLHQERDKVIQAIQGDANLTKAQKNWYLAMANDLGFFMVTNETLEDISEFNAETIVNAEDNPYVDAPTLEKSKAIAMVNKLATLHAMSYTPKSDRITTGELLKREPKGVSGIITIHQTLKEESRKNLFNGRHEQMMKGYIPDITHPNRDFEIAPIGRDKELTDKGYIRDARPMQRDEFDKGEPLYFYYKPYGKLDTLDSGFASLIGIKGKGTNLFHNHLNNGTLNPAIAAELDFKSIHAEKQRAMKRIAQGRSKPKRRMNRLLPLRDDRGRITDYRYVMSQSTKRDRFEKNESFDLVLGTMGSNMVNKVQGTQNNRRVVDIAYEIYQRDAIKDPFAFVNIGPNSPSEKGQEIYRLLPDDMKEYIESKFGVNGMFVHQDVFDTFFGKRKLSVANLQQIDTTDLKMGKRVMAEVNNLMATLLNNKYGIYIEETWQDFIKLAKDTIVIKGIQVLAGNLLSNQLVLLAAGVPLKDIAKQKEGYMAAKAYQRAELELRQLEITMKADPSGAGKDPANIKRERFLKHKMATSPVRDLMDAGVFQSINEDIYTLEETSPFKNRIDQLVDPVAEKIPVTGRKFLNTLAFGHGTPIYEALKDLTQYSDFMARYSLHIHNTRPKSKGGKGMTSEESIGDIVETFVNYDAPTNAYLQYANDMGTVMFTKYYLRIQRVIFKRFKEAPATATLIIGLQDILGFGVTDIYDSNIFNTPYLNAPWDNVTGTITAHPLHQLYELLRLS